MSRHPDSIGQAFLWALLPTLLLALHAPAVTYAQGVTDITSSGLGTVVPSGPPSDGVYNITGGTRPGGGLNLFHSFGDFSIGQGDIANFLNGSGLTTSNIIGRITGGMSNIDGTIQTTGFGNANLFLVNPSGIVFGPHGSFNVGGSVSMSTANYLRFEGTSTLFDMSSTPASLGPLSVAPVVAFGFTGSDLPAPITVQGSLLQVLEGKSLSLVGGDITVQAGTLRAPGGHINLVSVASPSEVLVPSFQTDSFTSMGTVTIQEGSLLDVSGRLDEFGALIGDGNSGTVLVRAGRLVMDASTIQADTLGTVDGARTAVDIRVLQNVTLTNGAAITTQTSAAGRGGDILIASDAVQLATGATIASATSGDGAGGDIFLNVNKLMLMSSAVILSQSATLSSPGLGQGGNVTIQGLRGAGSAAESVGLSGGETSLVSQTVGSGDGGRVAITSKSLAMDGGAFIEASTFSQGSGGNIVVRVQQASLSGGSAIISHTDFADPLAGAGGSITVEGLQGAGSKADSLTLAGARSRINSESFGTARLGDITVYAKTVNLMDSAEIQAGSDRDAAAMAGNVTIDADWVGISSGSRIASQVLFADAGQVTIRANVLTMDDGEIDTQTRGLGRGGDVVLNVGTVSLSNGAKINSSTSAAGRAGDITMNVGSLTLANHAEITSSSTGGTEIEAGAGDAGNITIQSGSTVVLNDSSITTEASEASGGEIEINAPEMVRLTNSRISTSVKGVAGDSDGGNITIDPQFVILQNSQLVAQANAGAGGAINVTAGVFIADPNSLVSASSAQGPQGTVNIQSPLQNVGGELAPLSEEFSSVAALLAQQCAARAADGKFSTFVVASREGVPVEPGGFLASPSLTSELLGSRLSGRDSYRPTAANTGAFQEYEARPIQLAKFMNACR